CMERLSLLSKDLEVGYVPQAVMPRCFHGIIYAPMLQ
ncbi:MAG: hypothetical protein ACI96W_002755, partial [Paraglaciecola sp.]